MPRVRILPSILAADPGRLADACRQCVSAGADGVHIEVHDCPEEALSDGPQALLPARYGQLMDQIRKLAELMNKSIDVAEEVAV